MYYNTKDSYNAGRYYDLPKPRYSFGAGLSYTCFAYCLDKAPAGEDLKLTLTIRNTGSRGGWAVPQLYIHRTQGVVTSRTRQLCGFDKVFLNPGESKAVSIEVPRDSLVQWDAAMKPVCPHGRIDWFLRDNGEDKLTGTFIV